MAQLQHCENNLTQSEQMICLCSHAYLIPIQIVFPPSKSFIHYIVSHIQWSETYPRPCVRYAHCYLIPYNNFKEQVIVGHVGTVTSYECCWEHRRASPHAPVLSPTPTPPCGTAPHLTLSKKHFSISNYPHHSNLYLVEINRMRRIANIIWFNVKILFWDWLFCKQLQISHTISILPFCQKDVKEKWFHLKSQCKMTVY
jgi:hypothetical protein